MSSKDEEVDMEFSFIKEDSVSQQEKVKAFWKFLDTQNLHLQKGNEKYEFMLSIR